MTDKKKGVEGRFEPLTETFYRVYPSRYGKIIDYVNFK